MAQPYTGFSLSNFEQRPYTPIAAIDAGQQDELAKQAQRLSLEAMFTDNQQLQANLERYRGLTPNLVAVSNLEGATARNTNPTLMARGKEGEAMQAHAAGEKLRQMLESDVAAGKAKNAADAAKHRHAQFTQELQVMHEFLPFMDTPMAQGAWTQTRSRLAPEFQQSMPEKYDPQMAPIIKKILVETPAHLQQLAQIAAQTAGNESVAKIQGQTSRDVADIGAKASRYAADKQAEGGNENKRKRQVFEAIGAGRETSGMLEEGTRYLAQEIGNTPEVKGLAQMLMMDVLEGKGDKAPRIAEQIRKLKETMWNQTAPGRLKGMNPFKGANSDLAAKVQQAFGAYEPEKYEYRIGPSGDIQRKKK